MYEESFTFCFVCGCSLLQALLENGTQVSLTGPVRYVYKNVDFSSITVVLANGSKVHYTIYIEDTYFSLKVYYTIQCQLVVLT